MERITHNCRDEKLLSQMRVKVENCDKDTDNHAAWFLNRNKYCSVLVCIIDLIDYRRVDAQSICDH